jgi:hypothetical protein
MLFNREETVEQRAASIRIIQAMRPSTTGKISTGRSMVARQSDKVRDVVFTNRSLFPCYNELPIAGQESRLRTHYREGCFDTYLPIRAWFFLGEITNSTDTLNNRTQHRIFVRDNKGKNNILIDFCDNSVPDKEFDHSLLKHGHTICIRFASRQKSSISIKIDEKFKKVVVYPTSLQTLLTTVSNEIKEHIPLRPCVKPSEAQILAHLIDKDQHPLHYKPLAPDHCWNCRKISNNDSELKLKKCARCMIALYCGKECQTNHWTATHKYCCNSHRIYSSMVNEVKQTLDNLAKYLFEFVSTDEEEKDGDDEN